MIVRINIGLGRAIESGLDCESVSNLLKLSTRDSSTVISYRQVESAGGDWAPEPVLWAELEVCNAQNVTRFTKALESLCVVLGEDSIAVAIVSPLVHNGVLIWNPAYTGEKYDFNLDFFTE
jgi:hypothetical protein